MKKNIHPEYYKEASVKCACGATYSIGATRKEIQVEICADCHPFYTGEKKLIDTAGRVEKFRKRTSSASGVVRKKSVKKAEKRAKKKPQVSQEKIVKVAPEKKPATTRKAKGKPAKRKK